MDRKILIHNHDIISALVDRLTIMMKKRNTKKSSEKSQHDENDTGGCGCCMNRHPYLDKYLKDISQESTIQGVKYIGSKDLHPAERLFWIVVLLTSVGFSLYLVNNVYRKFNANPVIISFQPQEISVASIPFPAITICSVNLLRTSVVKKAYDELIGLLDIYKENRSDPIMETKVYESLAHIDHLSQFCLSAKSFRRHLNQTLVDANGLPDLLEGLDSEIRELNANLTSKLIKVEEGNLNWWKEDMRMFDQATIHCEDLLLKCMWASDILPCKDIFFHVSTRNGRCCVFNMMPKFILQSISEDEGRAKMEMKDLPEEVIEEWRNFGREDLIQRDMDKVAKIKYPKHQMAGGRQYGLTVLANPDLREYSTCTANDGWGFKIIAHSPVSSPTIMDYGAAVPPESEVFVNIEPEVTVVADDEVLGGIDIDKRGCLMLNEPKAKLQHYNFYSPENCFSECWAELTYKNCSCVRDFMPRNSTQRLCRARNRKCADDVRANIAKNFGKSSLCGHCKASCTEILYKLQISHFDMREDNVSSQFTFENSQGNRTNATNYSIIHFYMGTDSLYAKERKPLYDKFDLIANSGGLLSLTLGISIISFIEMFYFCTLRAWFKFRSVLKDKQDNHGTGKQTMLGRRKSSAATIFPHDEYYNWSVANSAIGKKNLKQKSRPGSQIIF